MLIIKMKLLVPVSIDLTMIVRGIINERNCDHNNISNDDEDWISYKNVNMIIITIIMRISMIETTLSLMIDDMTCAMIAVIIVAIEKNYNGIININNINVSSNTK